MGPQGESKRNSAVTITSLICNTEISKQISSFFAAEEIVNEDEDAGELTEEEKYFLETTKSHIE